jgi:hypothetical protein
MSFIAELRCRNVIRTAVAYLAAAWLLIQVFESLLPVFGLPDTSMRYAFAVLAIGFVPIDPARDAARIEEAAIDARSGAFRETFGDGIAKELLNLLAKVEGLRVMSRTSSFQFKDSKLSVREIAEKPDLAIRIGEHLTARDSMGFWGHADPGGAYLARSDTGRAISALRTAESSSSKGGAIQ